MKRVLKVFSLVSLLVLLVSLCSCTPKDLTASIKKLEKAGYQVRVETDENEDVPYLATLLVYSNEETRLENLGQVVLFKTAKDAKTYLELFEYLAYENNSDEVDDEGSTKITAKRFGRWIVVGTDELIKAFK